ncbi:MAG: DotI/IcmL/TraM family protein, partial [Pseudomonadota bacterium]
NIHEGRDRYFATTADGRILQLVPLDQPNMSSAALMSWVSQAATEVMTFGFHDYQRRLQEASRHFTRRGWESFTTALQRSRIIESVETLQQVVTATPRSAPVLLQEGVFNGRHRWVVKLPLTVTFKSGNKTQSTNLEVTITIERVPTLESPNGVGIESWIAV